jgi:hypothetical protein
MNIHLKFQSTFTPVQGIDYSGSSIRVLSFSVTSLLSHHEYKCNTLTLKVHVQWENKMNAELKKLDRKRRNKI